MEFRVKKKRFVWEHDLEQHMFGLLETVKWNSNAANNLVCEDDNIQVYTVRSGYRLISIANNVRDVGIFQQLWSLKIAYATQISMEGTVK